MKGIFHWSLLLLLAATYGSWAFADDNNDDTKNSAAPAYSDSVKVSEEEALTVTKVDGFDAMRARFQLPVSESLASNVGEQIAINGNLATDFFYLEDVHQRTSQELAQVDALIEENFDSRNPEDVIAVFKFKVLNSADDDPNNDQTVVKEASYMNLRQVRDFLAKQKRAIEEYAVSLLRSTGTGPDRAEITPKQYDTSLPNLGLMVTRGIGIVGLAGVVAIWDGAPLHQVFNSTFLPALVSMYLSLSLDGFSAWAQSKDINPFQLKIGDTKTFADSPILEKFPLLAKLPVPLPFIRANPGAPIPESDRAGLFSLRGMLKMYGFICVYIGLASISKDLLNHFTATEPSTLGFGEAITNYVRQFDYRNVLSSGGMAVIGELLSIRTLGDIRDRYVSEAADGLMLGELTTEEAKARNRKYKLRMGAAVVVMSILNSVSQIRSAVSDVGLLTIGPSDNPYFVVNDGHVAMTGIAVALTIGYAKFVAFPKSSWLNLVPNVTKAVFKKIASVGGRVLDAILPYRRKGAAEKHGSCPSSFLPF